VRSVRIGLVDSCEGPRVLSRRGDDLVHRLVVRVCGDLLDDLFIETYA